jgi:GTP cyclohydrolase II
MEDRVGFIREKLDIKILILFILRRLPEPVTFEKLSELVLIDEGISYFDFAECVSELAGTEHIATDGHTYAITDKGRRNGEITENSLPFSVRVKAEKSAAEVAFALSRKSMISAAHTIRRKGGYTVDLSLSDGISDIVTLKLYSASQDQAVALEEGFMRNAEDIYNKLLKLILEA